MMKKNQCLVVIKLVVPVSGNSTLKKKNIDCNRLSAAYTHGSPLILMVISFYVALEAENNFSKPLILNYGKTNNLKLL